jgi:hypothetical protein
MTNPTTPFSWQMPTATDLVTDLPADFEVFGQAVATSMADLLGGTTGQILSKASNTDMDFTWIANDQGDITGVTASSPLTGGGTSGAITLGILSGTTSNLGAVQLSDSTSSTSTSLAATANAVKTTYDLANAAIPKSLIDAAGDLIVGTADNTAGRLAIGANGTVLQSNGTTASWAAPSGGGGMTLLSTTSLSGTSTTISSISGSYTNLLILMSGVTGSTGGELRLNGATSGFYAVKTFIEASTAYTQATNNLMTRWNEGGAVSGANTVALLVSNYASTTATKVVQNTGGFFNSTTPYAFNQFGWYNSTSAISSLTVTSDSGSFTAGTVLIYGVK